MIESLAIVQKWLTLGCFVALGAIGIVYAAWLSKFTLAEALRKFSKRLIEGAVVLAVAVLAVMYGGSKSTFRFDTGLTNNGSYATNDTVYAAWTYSGIPPESAVFIDYRLSGTTNEWENLAETTAAAGSWTGTLANATNYDYYVYSVYVPPIPAHTNGVWVGQAYETKSRVGAKSFILLNGKLIEHGRTIATPRAKRKDEEE